MRTLLCLMSAGAMGTVAWGVEWTEEAPVMKLKPFALGEVRVTDARLAAAMEANQRYLHDLDPDRLLKTFRMNAGLDAPGDDLGGWERPSCEVRGHTMGHYLSACAMTYESMGDTELKARADYIVAELAKCQEALGNGYLSAFPESFWSRFEARERVWAPFYVMHKQMAGLFDVHTRCGNEQALKVLNGMVSYFLARLDRFSDAEVQTMLDRSEEGGMCDLLWSLHAATGSEDARVLAVKMEKHSFLDPIVRGEDVLAGRHGNTHIPLAIGAARRYEVTGETRYASAAQYFWDRVVVPRTYATGGSTDHEHWGEPFELAHALSRSNHETCKTYNMLKLTRHLLCWTCDGKYGDFHERAFINGILGTQDPASGMLEYYVPQVTGYQRVFGLPMDAFWCCTGTGLETWSKVGDSIYFHDDNAIWVNLFISSSVAWEEKGIRLEQRTAFPEEEGTTLTLHGSPPKGFALCVRIPAWAAQGVEAAVNGEPVTDSPTLGTYLRIERDWRDGDTMTMRMPMTLHTRPMPDDPNLVAVMYGPVVLAGLTDPDGPTEPVIAGDPQVHQPGAEEARRVFHFLAESPDDTSWLAPVEGEPLTFRTVNQPFDITFVPFNEVIGERYGLYWPLVREGSDRHKGLRKEEEGRAFIAAVKQAGTPAQLEALKSQYDSLKDDPALQPLTASFIRAGWMLRGVDHVQPGNDASEKAHNLQGEETQAGPFRDEHWRHAGKWWSWDLKVKGDAPMTLGCLYWGSDAGRLFDILVDGTVVATQRLNNDAPNAFFVAEYPIPASLTKGKDAVTVRFQCKEHYAGGVFGCAMLGGGK